MPPKSKSAARVATSSSPQSSQAPTPAPAAALPKKSLDADAGTAPKSPIASKPNVSNEPAGSNPPSLRISPPVIPYPSPYQVAPQTLLQSPSVRPNNLPQTAFHLLLPAMPLPQLK